jgi:hypothetical protein
MPFDASNLTIYVKGMIWLEGELIRVRPSVQFKVERNTKMYLQVTHMIFGGVCITCDVKQDSIKMSNIDKMETKSPHTKMMVDNI